MATEELELEVDRNHALDALKENLESQGYNLGLYDFTRLFETYSTMYYTPYTTDNPDIVIEEDREAYYAQYQLEPPIIDRYEELERESRGKVENYWFDQLDYLIDTIPNEDRKDLDDALEVLKDGTNRQGYMARWDSGKWLAADTIGNIVGRHFNFLDSQGKELRDKGSFRQNLEGFWKRRREPDNEDVIIDCKLPSVILWHLLSKEGIRSDIMIHYSDERPKKPNFSAHPELRLRLADEAYVETRNGTSYPTYQEEDENHHKRDKKLGGMVLQFLAKEDEPFLVSPNSGSNYVNHVIPSPRSITELLRTLDKYFFIGNLMYSINSENDALIGKDHMLRHKRKQYLLENGWQDIVLALFPEEGDEDRPYWGKDNLRRYYRHLLRADPDIS